MDQPLLGVLPTREFVGANSVTDPCEPVLRLPASEAFSAEWRTDAHFVCYALSPDGDMPRMNKSCLGSVRAAGGDVVSVAFAFDFDNPGHTPWSPGQAEEWMAHWLEAVENDACLGQWSTVYSTRAGARAVYLLDSPVPADQGETMHRWLHARLGRLGFKCDALHSWNWLFRLPRVVRDDIPSWYMRSFIQVDRPDARLSVSKVGTVGHALIAEPLGTITPIDRPRPDDASCDDELRVVSEKGYLCLTEFGKEAKRRLRGRDCWECLFNHAPLAEKGARNSRLTSYIGCAVSLLVEVPGATPEGVYALFRDPVSQLGDDEDWLGICWKLICRFWSKEEARVAAREAEIAQELKQIDDRTLAIAERMREWSDDPRLHADDEQARQFVLRHAVAACCGSYYVLRPDGRYDSAGVPKDRIAARARALGMSGVVVLEKPGPGNRSVPVSAQRILDEQSTEVRSIAAVPETVGGEVAWFDEARSEMRTCAYRRNPALEPCFDPMVDEWLRLMFGEHYERVERWLAWSLAFEQGSICALSICGPPGCGKKLLTMGLSECLEVPSIASADDLIGEHQYGLLRSPFLVVNEGWPTGRRQCPADQFRAIVSGEPLLVKRKYEPPTIVRNPMRVIFTANNREVIHGLTGGRNLSPEDRTALAVRVMHVEGRVAASDWLRMRGNASGTRMPGRLWIAEDGTGRSDYVVARHLLHIYANRGLTHPGERFLVDGDDCGVIREMRTQSGNAPEVVEALIRMIESPMRREGMVVDKGRVFVTPAEIMLFHRANMPQGGARMTPDSAARVLRGLVVPGWSSQPQELPQRPGSPRLWYEIDTALLLDSAERDGWGSTKLRVAIDSRTEAPIFIKEPPASEEVGKGRIFQRIKEKQS